MTYQFGDFRYDATARLLFRGPHRVPLVPKVADTLHVLIERHGQVIEKAELIQLIWPDATVEEIGLARNISLLRKALDDESPDAPIIETVPRRGYRFAAPVTVGTPSAPTKRTHWQVALPIAAVLILAAVVHYQFYVPSRFVSQHRAAALAVVPFPCACPGIDAEAFTEGLTGLLVTDLARHQSLQLVAPSTVRRHQRAGMSMGLMGRLLRLDALIEGSVQLTGPDLRATVRLVDVHTGKVIWSETYTEPASDPATAQATISRHAATAIAARLLPK